MFKKKVVPLRSVRSTDLWKSADLCLEPDPRNLNNLNAPTVNNVSITFPAMNSGTPKLMGSWNDNGPQIEPPDEVKNAQTALLNADSVLAKASDSFKKTFDFITNKVVFGSAEVEVVKQLLDDARPVATQASSAPGGAENFNSNLCTHLTTEFDDTTAHSNAATAINQHVSSGSPQLRNHSPTTCVLPLSKRQPIDPDGSIPAVSTPGIQAVPSQMSTNPPNLLSAAYDSVAWISHLGPNENRACHELKSPRDAYGILSKSPSFMSNLDNAVTNPTPDCIVQTKPDPSPRSVAIIPTRLHDSPSQPFGEPREGTVDFVLVAPVSPNGSSQRGVQDARGTQDETQATMEASLGDLILNIHNSIFGSDNDLIQSVLKHDKSCRSVTPTSAPRPLEEEGNDLAMKPEGAKHKKKQLEPEDTADFSVDEVIMKIENEEITCSTDETFEVVSDAKYYPVEVTSPGVSTPTTQIPLCVHEVPTFITSDDNLVEHQEPQEPLYLNDTIADIPLHSSDDVLHELDYLKAWEALSYKSGSSGSKGDKVKSTLPPRFVAVEHVDKPRETILVNKLVDNLPDAANAKDPPGEGPWLDGCLVSCYGGSIDASTISTSNFIFCHQSPQDLGDSFSASMAELGSQVQQIDGKHPVIQSVSEIGNKLTNIWKQADEAFGVSLTTKHVSTVLKEKAKKPPKPEDFQRTWAESKRHMQQLDHEHRITERAVLAVSEGTDFVKQSMERLGAESPGRHQAFVTGTA